MASILPLIKGKRVIFVGPAPILIGTKKGKEIDSYDVVVRTNNGLNISHEMQQDYGKRCDILYVNGYYSRHMNFSIAEAKSRGLKCIVFKTYKDQRQKLFYSNSFMISAISREGLSQTLRHVGRLPLIGTLLIFDILQHRPHSLMVCGIDFYDQKQKWVKGYQVCSHKEGKHNIKRNKKALIQLYSTHRIQVDDLSLPYLLKP